MKFKIGDWIKAIEPSHTNYGAIYKIIGEYFPSQYKVKHYPSGSIFPLNYDLEECYVLTPAPGMKTEPKTEGVKHDSGKRQWWFMWQFLPELEQVVDILDYGNKKYPADDGSNWRKVDNAKNRYTSAAMRHWSAWLGGEKVDAETGKSHLAHMITNLLFLIWFERSDKL